MNHVNNQITYKIERQRIMDYLMDERPDYQRFLIFAGVITIIERSALCLGDHFGCCRVESTDRDLYLQHSRNSHRQG